MSVLGDRGKALVLDIGDTGDMGDTRGGRGGGEELGEQLSFVIVILVQKGAHLFSCLPEDGSFSSSTGDGSGA